MITHNGGGGGGGRRRWYNRRLWMTYARVAGFYLSVYRDLETRNLEEKLIKRKLDIGITIYTRIRIEDAAARYLKFHDLAVSFHET